jgi:arylsulfatase A-like enzyme
VIGMDGKRRSRRIPPAPRLLLLLLAASLLSPAAPAPLAEDEAELAKKTPVATRPLPRQPVELSPAPAGTVDAPNLLLVTFDTTRADHFSCYGYPLLTTPHGDALATRGVLFTRASTVIPVTGPSHASILTSLYPRDHGAIRNGVPMVEGVPTLATILSSHGYRTAAFVSGWTVRGKLTRLNRGFHIYDDDMTDRYHMVNSQRPGDQTADHAIAWLQANQHEPFFVWLHFFDPHAPYRGHGLALEPNPAADQPLDSRRKLKHYDQEIAFADAQLGRVLEAMDRIGVGDSTFIVLTADHGEAFGEHGESGHGRKLYETTQHVPLILVHPSLPAGERSSLPATTLDIVPTILSLLQLPPLPLAQGIALNEALQTPVAYREREIYQEAFPGARKGIWRFFGKRLTGEPIQVAVRRGRWKAILDPRSDELLLFDLARDPDEVRNLAGEEGSPTRQLHPLLTAHAGRQWNPPDSDATLTEDDRRRLEALGYIE